MGSEGGIGESLGSEGVFGDSLGSERFGEPLIPIPTPISHRYFITPVFYYTGIRLHQWFLHR